MKRKWQSLALGIAAILFGGCVVQSIQPLFTEKDYLPFPNLVGTWVQKDENKEIGVWTFAADGAKYQLTHADEEGRKATFTAAAGKIGTNIFFDIPLRDSAPGPKLNDLMLLHLIPAHLFVKAVKTNDTLVLLAMDLDWLKKHLAANPKATPHVIREETPILTGSTEELKQFVAKFANDPLVFKNEIKLEPKKAGR